MEYKEIIRKERNLHAQLRRINKRITTLKPVFKEYNRLNEEEINIFIKLADLNALLPEGIRERRYRAGLKKFYPKAYATYITTRQ
jgi:hypothetical protein